MRCTTVDYLSMDVCPPRSHINALRIRRRFPCRDFSCRRTVSQRNFSGRLGVRSDCVYVGGSTLLHLIAPKRVCRCLLLVRASKTRDHHYMRVWAIFLVLDFLLVRPPLRYVSISLPTYRKSINQLISQLINQLNIVSTLCTVAEPSISWAVVVSAVELFVGNTCEIHSFSKIQFFFVKSIKIATLRTTSKC